MIEMTAKMIAKMIAETIAEMIDRITSRMIAKIIDQRNQVLAEIAQKGKTNMISDLQNSKKRKRHRRLKGQLFTNTKAMIRKTRTGKMH